VTVFSEVRSDLNISSISTMTLFGGFEFTVICFSCSPPDLKPPPKIIPCYGGHQITLFYFSNYLPENQNVAVCLKLLRCTALSSSLIILNRRTSGRSLGTSSKSMAFLSGNKAYLISPHGFLLQILFCYYSYPPPPLLAENTKIWDWLLYEHIFAVSM
jgi:hypothetical protein